MKRQGQTAVWTFVTETPEGNVLAIPDFSPTERTYEFHKSYWEMLPIIPE